MTPKNPAAVALGRLGGGRRKTPRQGLRLDDAGTPRGDRHESRGGKAGEATQNFNHQ
jgi:hypothetical protein